MTQTHRRTQTLKPGELAAWRVMLNAHAAVVERIERDLARAHCLPLGSYDVLIALEEAPQHRLRMRELAQAVVLNRSTLTRRVDRLEREGFLKRERSGGDKRGAYATLTDQGRDALRSAWPVYARGIRDYFARHLSETELSVLTEALGRVYHAAQGIER